MLSRILTRNLLSSALLVVLGVVALSAQGPYPRIRVLEEWSSATCVPCVAATPVIDAAVILDSGVVSIRYHMNFPQPNDPWNLYNPTDPERRYLYYDGSGNIAIPKATANGGPLMDPRPSNEGAQLTAAIKNAVRTSPIQITVTQNGGKIKVVVKSDVALNAHTLQVALVSRYKAFPNASAVTAILQGSSSNGEYEFHDMLNKMYPDYNGTALNIPAGGQQTFEFAASVTTSDIVFPAGQQYAIAFVQNNNTKVIQQGGVSANMTTMPYSFNFFSRSQVSTSAPNPYQRVGRGQTSEVDVTVTNNGSGPATVDLSIANAAALANPLYDATAEFSPSTVTLAANESKPVKLKVTGSAVRSSFFSVEPGSSASDGLAVGGSVVYYLVDGGRVVTYYGINNAQWALTAQAVLNDQDVAADAVHMPFGTELQAAYPVTDFDAAVFAFDAGWVAIQGPVFNAISAMEASGKGLWISGQANMYTTFDASRNGGNALFQPVRDFFNKTLGIDFGGIRQRATQNGNQISVSPFTLKGVAGDSIGKGIPAFTANQIAPGQWQSYATLSDIIKLTATSKAKSWLYYSDSIAAIGGIRVSTSNGARVVYSSLDFQSIIPTQDGLTARNAIAAQVLNWILAKAPGATPILYIATTTLQYGQVQVGTTKDIVMPIKNTGGAPLVITDMELSGGDGAFTIIQGGTASGPVTIAPNATQNVTVRFAPLTVKTGYAASINFTSNSESDPIAQLRGAGVVSSVETDVASETGAIGLRLVGSNPVTDASALELRSMVSTTISIVDQVGRTVATIFNGNPNGTQRVALQTSTLPAGTYNVVASNGSESAVLSIVVVR